MLINVHLLIYHAIKQHYLLHGHGTRRDKTRGSSIMNVDRVAVVPLLPARI
jgi:hypothetical protein